jgi:hypothetical protein
LNGYKLAYAYLPQTHKVLFDFLNMNTFLGDDVKALFGGSIRAVRAKN